MLSRCDILFQYNMAMQRIIVSLLVSMAILMELSTAVDHTVGDAAGWDVATNINKWSSNRSYKVGDNLIFKYTSFHNVIEVPKSDYDTCMPNNLITAYSDGNTIIPLSSPGKRYFICGTSGHCSSGMKLVVDATPASTSPPPSPKNVTGTPPPSKSPPATSPKASAPSANESKPPTSVIEDDAPAIPPTIDTSTISPTTSMPSAANARDGLRSLAGLVVGLLVASYSVLVF